MTLGKSETAFSAISSARKSPRYVKDAIAVLETMYGRLKHYDNKQIVMPPVYLYEENGVEIEEYQAQISIDNLLLASCRNPTLTVARNEASQELLSFLLDLITQRAAPREPQHYDCAPAGGFAGTVHHTAAPQGDSLRFEVRDGTTSHHSDDQDMGSDRSVENDNEIRHAEEDRNMCRKRHYQPSRDELQEEPSLVRRRMEDSALSYERHLVRDENEPVVPASSSSAQQVEEKEPLFYVDNNGDRKPHADRALKALTEEQRIKVEVDAYQELMKKMFQDRENVMSKLDGIVWDATRECTWVEFSSKLSVSTDLVLYGVEGGL